MKLENYEFIKMRKKIFSMKKKRYLYGQNSVMISSRRPHEMVPSDKNRTVDF